MEVKLIAYTPNPEKVVAAAALTTVSSDIVLPEDVSESKAEKVIETIIKRGHYSVLEHANFTFAIKGISRVCSHQLVRHRIASYSQQSQRYVSLDNPEVYIPSPITNEDREVRETYKKILEDSIKAYKKLLELGVNPEDARYVLPQSITTNIIMTMNARELLHFLSLRLCYRAQEEIRRLAFAILKEVYRVAPKIFKHAGPRCKGLGYCPEDYKNCPLYKHFGNKK